MMRLAQLQRISTYSTNSFYDSVYNTTSTITKSASSSTGYIKDSAIDAVTLPAISALKRVRQQLESEAETKNTDITMSVSIPGVVSITLVNKKQ
jgi:hypothetical protein